MTFLPLVTVTRRDRVTRSMTRQIDVPLFRSYLFVTNADHWPPIQHTRGVARVLMSDGRPSYVDHHAIAAIQEALRGAEALSAASPLWKTGTPCSLAVGPLAGMPAVVTHLAPHDEIAQVTIMFLGHLRTVSVPLDCLRARDE